MAIHLKTPSFLIKLFHYEYWTWWVFYLPILPYWLYLAWKARSLTYFTAANPGIEAGGFFGESKIAILNKIDDQYKPRTVFIPKASPLAQVKEKLLQNGIPFPLIAKPNVGERGNQVEKLLNETQLSHYLDSNGSDCIIQEFVAYDLEMGVLFHRLPHESHGRVSSVTLKKFLSVMGDGISTVEQLMLQSDRARFQLKKFRGKYPELLHQVVLKGETRLLEPIGNHCRGTLFYSGNHLITKQMNQVFSRISLPIDGFYYGRFDVKVKSLDDLYAGKNIRILELNGVSAEPAHIYDPAYTLFRAYRDFIHHMNIVYRIGRQNIQDGIRPVALRDVWAMVNRHFGFATDRSGKSR